MIHPARVTAPLKLRCHQDPLGRVVLQAWPHRDGLVVLELILELPDGADALDDRLYLVTGELRGGGPWRVGDCVLSVLGCHQTDGPLADQHAQWLSAVEAGSVSLPQREQVRARVAALGGELDAD